MMNFSEALYMLRQGKKIKRKPWPDTVYMQIIDNVIYQIVDARKRTLKMGSFELLVMDWIVVD